MGVRACPCGRICVVGLAPTHPALHKRIVKVNFDLGMKGPAKLSGKRKREALHLRPEHALCCVSCDDGSQYLVRACVDGDLMELNERLARDVAILQNRVRVLCAASDAVVVVTRLKNSGSPSCGERR